MVGYVTAKIKWSLDVWGQEGVVNHDDDVISNLPDKLHRGLDVSHTEQGGGWSFHPQNLEGGREGGRGEGGRAWEGR